MTSTAPKSQSPSSATDLRPSPPAHGANRQSWHGNVIHLAYTVFFRRLPHVDQTLRGAKDDPQQRRLRWVDPMAERDRAVWLQTRAISPTSFAGCRHASPQLNRSQHLRARGYERASFLEVTRRSLDLSEFCKEATEALLMVKIIKPRTCLSSREVDLHQTEAR